MNRFLLMAVPFLAVCGLLPAAPVPPDAGKPPFYYPTRVGTKWTYDNKGGEARGEIVTASEEKNGQYLVTIKVTAPDWKDDASTTYSRYEVSKEGIVLVGLRLNTPDERPLKGETRQLLKLPHRVGEKWGTGETRVAGKVEKVTVPLGTFEAIRVDVNENSTVWYAPGVGRVRSKNQNFDVVLTSFALPKD